MYNTLISSVFEDTELFGNETIEESPELSNEHVSPGEEKDYPYSEEQHIEEHESKEGSPESYLLPKVNAKQTTLNATAVQRSGISFGEIMAALQQNVDVASIRLNLSAHNQNMANGGYIIDSSEKIVDAVFTEAVHQFQMANYIDPGEHDGILGQSTFETLGIFNHRLKNRVSGYGLYGQGVLNGLSSVVAAETNNEFTAANWFEYILKPAWLGVKIHDGVHLMLLRILKESEKWLLNQPQYRGMTPASLGKALGFDKSSRYSAARLSSANQAMHGFGLAIDIHVPGNPWIGAGWILNDKELLKERYRMIEALRKASGDPSLPGPTVFKYLHSIAEINGNDTEQSYKILKQRNDEFIRYLMGNNAELAYWKKSLTFGGRNPLKGFLNLHTDLVCALRQVSRLAWGALDFGPYASGDIMHFDNRTIGFGKTLCNKIGGYVPSAGHPSVVNEVFETNPFPEQFELHEAIGEAEWTDDIPLRDHKFLPAGTFRSYS